MEFIKKKRLLRSMASKYPAIMVVGTRGANKERLVREVFPNKSFIDLSNKSVYNIAKQSPLTFLLAFPDGAIINDIALLPSMVKVVRHYVERSTGENGKWVIISTPDILDIFKDDVSTIDNNGFGLLRLSGFSIDELDDENIPTSNPFQVMLKGQKPDILANQLTIEEYLNEIIDKDVCRFINISNKEAFKNFVKACAPYSGMPMSMNAIATKANTTAPTAKSWLTIMEHVGLIRQINDGENARSTRLFFTDTGLLCHLLGIEKMEQIILEDHKESITRTFAFNELVRGRDNKQQRHNINVGRKCDFTADWRQHYTIMIEPNIEVTNNTIERIKEIKSIEAKPLILYLGETTYTNACIDCISFRDWEKLAEGIDYFS